MAKGKPRLTRELLEAEQRAEWERVQTTLKAQVTLLTKERDTLLQQLNVIESLDLSQHRTPEWMTPRAKKQQGHHGTACLLVTDTHFDEVVDPAQIDGLNAYNREIADMRLRRLFERTVILARRYLAGLTYDGVAVFLGGDIFSGNIHEELARTNADTLFGSLLHWLGPMVAGIIMLADEFKRVHVAGVPGNHGRLTKRPIAKQRAADNLDWLLYRLMARDLAKDQRITWTVPDSADAHVQVHGIRYLLTHGDQFRGGSGISAALAPLLLGAHRKTRRQAAAGKPYDIMLAGHWHQTIWLPPKGLMVGPCMKGFDEWAYVSNFEPEPPTQSFWITTPEHGVTFSAPVFVMDRKAEGW